MKATRPSGLSNQRADEPTSNALAGGEQRRWSWLRPPQLRTMRVAGVELADGFGVGCAARLRPRSSMASVGRNETMTTCSPDTSRRAQLPLSPVETRARTRVPAESSDHVHGACPPYSESTIVGLGGGPVVRRFDAPGCGWMSTSSRLRRRRRGRRAEAGLQRRPPEDLAFARPPSRRARSQTSRLPMPMKSATYSVAGCSKTRSGRVVLLDAAVAHDGQPITESQRLGLVVGDEHRGEAEAAVQARGSRREPGRADGRRGCSAARRTARGRVGRRGHGQARRAAAVRR